MGLSIVHVNTGTLPAPSGGGGGVEDTVHHLSVAMAELGHDVTVVDIPDPMRAPPPYQVVEVAPWWRGDGNLPSHALRGLAFQQGVRRALRRLFRGRRYDVVNFHGQIGTHWGLALAKRLGALAVFSSHNATWSDARACRSLRARARFVFELLCFHGAHGVIADSQWVVDNLVRHLGLPAATTCAVPIGVPDGWFRRLPVPPELRQKYAPNGERVVLCVARIAPYKDQLTLVRAMARVAQAAPDARLVLVGPLSDARYVARVRGAIAELGLAERVTLAGRVSVEEHRLLYELCDVFVLPSVAESQGLSALEAMAAGRPVVGSDIGPIAHMLQGGAGLLATPGDADAFAAAILRVLEEPGLARALGETAQGRAHASYRWSALAQQTVDVYHHIAALTAAREGRAALTGQASDKGR